MATMHQRRSRLTCQQQNELIKPFVAGATARAVAGAQAARLPSSGFSGTEVGSSPPSSRHPPEPCCRSSGRGGGSAGSIVHMDTSKAYSALDVSDFHHRRINHSRLFADHQNHINGIEGVLESGEASSVALQLKLRHLR